MPRGDRTGPNGEGRMTGRKMGLCVGNDTPGYTNSSKGFGCGNRNGRSDGNGLRGGFGGRGFGFRRRSAWNDPNPIDKETVPNWVEQEFQKLKEQVQDLQKRFSDSGK